MNVKQKMTTTVSELVTRINNYKSRSHYENSCFQGHCPTTEEIKNDRVKSLANRLKAGSYKETLTNILEWQDRNLSFWHERHPISSVCMYSLGGSLIIFVIGFVMNLFSFIIWRIQILNWFIPFSVAMLGGSAVTAFTIGWMIRSNRRIPVWEGLKNVFKPSLSINALLENKLGICRDYAKLTACLLLNIYPEADIYFAYAPSHVATGIKVDNELYMLDQRLPILTIGKWKDYRHQKRRQQRKLEQLGEKCLIEADMKPFLSKTTAPLDTRKLATRMTELLNVENEGVNEPTLVLNIPWKKGAVMYEDNELVNYSLARRLKTKTSTELIKGRQIKRIEVDRQDDDITFVYFNLDTVSANMAHA